jgi:hypothetical protein
MPTAPSGSSLVSSTSACAATASRSPGHQFPDFEQVVEQGDGYDVVRKHEKEAAEVAEETDPRS